jgi:REP element-mobilizing transposase RayT
LSLRKQQKQTQNDKNPKSRFQNQGKNSLSSIVGSYKAAVTKHVRRLDFDFAWQSRFYDHIIRDRTSFLRICQYIDNNPTDW